MAHTLDPTAMLDQKSRALLDAARGGDADAVALLLAMHQGRLIGYFRARLLPDALLAESVKIVFENMLAEVEPPPDEQSIRVWLLELAGAELLRRAKKKQLPGGEVWAGLCWPVDSSENVTAADLRYISAAADLPAVLASLDEGDREALQMVYRDRHDRATLAEKLRRSETAVAALVERARTSLRERMVDSERRKHDDA
ncbi:MAG: hypothetical protein WD030_00115 [Pirellulales bacterium]